MKKISWLWENKTILERKMRSHLHMSGEQGDKWYVFYFIMLKCLAILWQPCNKWNHKLPYIKQNEVLFCLETFFLEEEDVISAAGSKGVEKSGEKEVDWLGKLATIQSEAIIILKTSQFTISTIPSKVNDPFQNYNCQLVIPAIGSCNHSQMLQLNTFHVHFLQ